MHISQENSTQARKKKDFIDLAIETLINHNYNQVRTQSNDYFDILGKKIASDLRHVDRKQFYCEQIYCEKTIFEIAYYAREEKLTENLKIILNSRTN